ncbi:MAG: glutamate-cysteine ligase family protein [Tatlockia sp.]|jgi:gamma-glutamyl:cysteine ligase YbdK (ATP-grasp superfamily)
MSNFYSLFTVLGLEIEYMLVDRETLEIKPLSDVLLHDLAGHMVNEVPLGNGEIAASNELVLHVIELKNNGPKPPSSALVDSFQQAITTLLPHLAKHNLQLLPSGAHPWMNPHTETKRWPHGNQAIYQQYDAIFDCQGHGWANLQSMHMNLPFANEDEFCKLHNAIRLILPLLPALAASTPFLDGKKTGLIDSRLYFYGKNQQRIPSISGEIIPEFIRSQTQYKQTILEPMYKEISPFDKEGLLQHQWLNSRAAIPKFDCQAIEIRIIDSQECVQADVAIALAVTAILKQWIESSDYYLHQPCEVMRLRAVYDLAIKEGFAFSIDDSQLCRQWQLPPRTMTAQAVWSHLIERVSSALDAKSQQTLEFILSQGNLSERLLRACGNDHSKTNLSRLYRQLGHCLSTNTLFNPA